MNQIILPNRFNPRPYQAEAMAYFDKGGLRGVSVWHRRAGKDTTAIHQIAKAAHRRRGLYWHLLPTQRQGRKVVWDAFTRGGERLLDQALPAPLRKGDPNNTEMKVNLKCGSMYQVVGADSYDSLVGSNPIGVVFSEWSLTDPRIWDYVRPILMENGGWAWFIYTPRGYNHGFDIKQTADKSPGWFSSLKTIKDTSVLTQADVDKEILEGMPEELAQQEFYCSFSAANVGAILGSYVERAQGEGRITDDDMYDPNGADVVVSSDIGYRDTAAWWFWQPKADGVALVDYMEDVGMDAEDWIARLHTVQMKIGTVYLPHDARAKTFQTKHSVLEQFLRSGFPTRIVPQVRILDRINAARSVFPHCRFQKTRTERGLMSLRDWSYGWDDQKKVFSKDPLHNWASHGGDGFSYGALMLMNHVKDWGAKLAKMAEKVSGPAAKGANYAFSLEQLHEAANDNRILRI